MLSCKEVNTPAMIVDGFRPLPGNHPLFIPTSKNVDFCQGNSYSCCSLSDLKKIGDNFNDEQSLYSSRELLIRDVKTWTESLDSVFTNEKKLIKFAQEVLKIPKAHSDFKKSAQVIIKTFSEPNLRYKVHANASKCYKHTEEVAKGAICSLCNLDAKTKFDDFTKTIHLSNEDVQLYHKACIRHIGETNPIVAQLLKAIWQLSQANKTYEKPVDSKMYKNRSNNLNGLVMGNIDMHIQCNVFTSAKNTNTYCNNFVRSYYSLNVLTKPEYALMSEMAIVYNFIAKFNLSARDRQLVATSKIIKIGGIEQIWKNFWEFQFGNIFPETTFSKLADLSQLRNLGVERLTSLYHPTGLILEEPKWWNPKKDTSWQRKDANKVAKAKAKKAANKDATKKRMLRQIYAQHELLDN